MRKIVSVSLAAVSCLMLSCGQRNQSGPQKEIVTALLDSIEIKYAPTLAKGEVAPEFMAKDTSGVDVSLSDFKGKYVVLDFWATWCPDCRDEIPELKAIYSEYKDKKIDGKDVEFVSISFDTDAKTWKDYIVKEDMQWHQISTLIKWRQDPISGPYQIKWIPTFFVVAPDGTIAGSAIKAFRIREILEAQ